MNVTQTIVLIISETMDSKKLDRKLVIMHNVFIADWCADGALKPICKL